MRDAAVGLERRKDPAVVNRTENAGKEATSEASSVANFGASEAARIPESVRECVASTPGVYDARRLRSQREIIRDVMMSAADCDSWLTLGELRALTRYGEASISAQLRHSRKTEYGGYEVVKRHREGASPTRLGTDGRGECVWEYRLTRGNGERATYGNGCEVAREEKSQLASV